jgi:hypothetical protein
VLAGPPRAGGNAGLELPIRTRPPSEMTAGLSFVLTTSFDLAIGEAPIGNPSGIAQTLHVGRESVAFVKNQESS